MDNVCHTLVGAALAEAGLKRRTPLGAATLMIGANFPDIDVLAVPLGHSVDFRRGWTHGLLALVVLPVLLTWLMLAWHRWVTVPRRAGGGDAPAPVPRQLLLLAAISIATHPALDWLNEYGMRWLMPFSSQWSYGDSLFIIDPWLWLAFGIGVLAARRAGAGATRIALGISALYIGAAVALAEISERMVRDELTRGGIPASARMMVSASFFNALERRVLVESDGRIHYGTFGVFPRRPVQIERVIDTNARDPGARRAAMTPEGRRFLTWSRFPYYRIEPGADSMVVTIGDARYALGRRGGDWATVRVRLPRQPGDAPVASRGSKR